MYRPTLLLLGVVGPGCAAEAIVDCEPIGPATPFCGWQNPEDLAALPDDRHVLVSEYGGMHGERPGFLSLLDLETEARTELYAGGATDGEDAAWGDAECVEPPTEAFSPHGIDLSTRPDGALQLAVVQHAGRESVELFEVLADGDSWALEWRGCALAHDDSVLNDVVATPEGGLLVTRMMGRDRGMAAAFVRAKTTARDGWLNTWESGVGMEPLPGTVGAMPNGLALDPYGDSVYVNYSVGGAIRRFDRHTGALLHERELPPLDNSTWDANDGNLLVTAGMASVTEYRGCASLEEGTCPGTYAVLSVDPETFTQGARVGASAAASGCVVLDVDRATDVAGPNLVSEGLGLLCEQAGIAEDRQVAANPLHAIKARDICEHIVPADLEFPTDGRDTLQS